MTHQIKDTILYMDNDYVIIDSEQGKLISDYLGDLEDFKQERNVINLSSANHRGHNEEYKVINGQLWGQTVGERHIAARRYEIVNLA